MPLGTGLEQMCSWSFVSIWISVHNYIGYPIECVSSEQLNVGQPSTSSLLSCHSHNLLSFLGPPFARSLVVMTSSGKQGSSSSRQQEVGHCLRFAAVAVDRRRVVNVAPPPHRWVCTANPSAQMAGDGSANANRGTFGHRVASQRQI